MPAEEFRLGDSQYDQSTYLGRLRHFLDIVDPRTLLIGDAKLQSSVKLLDDYKTGQLSPGVTNSQLWEAQKITQAILHPDTGKKIFMPFRMSGFVPFGTVTVVGMLLPNPSMASVAFWQALNQSHNAGVNFANRNASAPMSNTMLGVSFAAATTTAAGGAVFLHQLIKSKEFRRFQHHSKHMSLLVPYFAVALANQVNILCMRNSELTNGVEVYEEDGRLVGRSPYCGRMAVSATMITRAVLPAPILLLPPLIISVLEKSQMWKKFPAVRFPLHVAACMGAFSLALPLTIALFPQTIKIKTSHLETEVRLATRDQHLYFSRGM